jgi:hypothetical protein
MNVYKRENLKMQLDMLADQTLLPVHVWIVQDEKHQNILPIVDERKNQKKQMSEAKYSNILVCPPPPSVLRLEQGSFKLLF